MFIDTDVMVIACNPNDPRSIVARARIAQLESAGTGAISHQIVREFVSAVTRPITSPSPTRRGLGFSSAQAWDSIRHILTRIGLLGDDAAGLEQLEILSRKTDCRGKQIHDANIVATMLAHGERQLLSFNGRDFARYADVIEVVIP